MSDDLYDGPCEAGCISFHGGERKHHKDCGHYPHSLTKVNADCIEELKAKLKKAKGILEREIQRVQEIQSVFPPPHKVGLVHVEEEYRRMLVEMMGDTDD
jgi:hypothetical protein